MQNLTVGESAGSGIWKRLRRLCAASVIALSMAAPEGCLQSRPLPQVFTVSSNAPAPSTTMRITIGSLPDGNPGVPYHATLIAVGGMPPLTWSILSGQLPSGLQLNSATGVIAGTPSLAGSFSFTVQVTDSSSPSPQTATRVVNANIVTVSASGPQLPQVFLDTTFPDTTNYTVTTVVAGGDLQGAINAASCSPNGTVLRLASGATYTGNYFLPAKTCAAGQWIILRTDTADSNLPPPGVRITPSFSSTLAKIFSASTLGPIQTNSNANHYWFMGVEIGAPSSVTAETSGIVTIGNGETSLSTLPDHIYFDRCYIHGNATGGFQRGVEANGASIAVVDSYIENIHYVGFDTQAVGAWNTPGPIKIVNNFLEAAGENIMFGGADPYITNLVMSDIEIRQNHFFKPLSWKSDDPSYAGIPWSIKNLIELKNGQRILFEGNLLENNWAQAQTGFGVLFNATTPSGTCPLCTVADITFRYNILRHSGNGMTMAGAFVSSNGVMTQPSQRISIHDNLFYDINGPAWGGATGILYQITNGTLVSPLPPPPHDITITHNTAFQTGTLLAVGDNHTNNPIPNFVFTNNIQPHNTYGVFGSGAGVGNETLVDYFTSPVFTNNVIEALPNGVTPAYYPAGNFFPPDWPTVQFVDFAGGDYHLQPTSPYHNAGTDGKDVGTNIDAVEAATATAEPSSTRVQYPGVLTPP